MWGCPRWCFGSPGRLDALRGPAAAQSTWDHGTWRRPWTRSSPGLPAHASSGTNCRPCSGDPSSGDWGRVSSGRTVSAAASRPRWHRRLVLRTGQRAFVKAIAPDAESGAPGGQDFYRREARIAANLPGDAPAPRLLADWEEGGWVVLVFEDVDGRHPVLPWDRNELRSVLDAVAMLADRLTPSPVDAPPARVPGGGDGWMRLARNPSRLDRLDGLDPWVGANLDVLAALSEPDRRFGGSTLLHTDIRADNILFTEGGVVFVDWPHAQVGAPWLDLVLFLPSVAMQGGPDPESLFWAHPSARRRRTGLGHRRSGWSGRVLHPWGHRGSATGIAHPAPLPAGPGGGGDRLAPSDDGLTARLSADRCGSPRQEPFGCAVSHRPALSSSSTEGRCRQPLPCTSKIRYPQPRQVPMDSSPPGSAGWLASSLSPSLTASSAKSPARSCRSGCRVAAMCTAVGPLGVGLLQA